MPTRFAKEPDNARHHYSKETERFIDRQEGDILPTFLPADSPPLNPDEQLWNHASFPVY